MPLGETIRSGVRWLAAGKVGHKILSFAVGVVMARLLVPEDFGLVVTVQIYTGIAGFVAGGGMGQALVRAESVSERDCRAVFTAQLAIGCLLYGFFYFFSDALAAWYDEPLYSLLLKVSALTFLVRPFANLPNSLLHRAMRFKAVSLLQLLVLATTASVSIPLAAAGFGPWSLILSGFAGAAVNVVVASWLARWRPWPVFDVAAVRRFGGYGVKVSGNDIVNYIRGQTGNFFAGRFLGTADAGLLHKANAMSQIPTEVVASPTYNVVFRALARIQDNSDQSKYVYIRSLTLLLAYTLPLYAGLSWVAEPLIVTLYGEKWRTAAAALEVLALAGPLRIVAMQSGAVTAARNLLGRELFIQIAGLAILAGICAFAYRWGIRGLAWATVLAAGSLALMMAVLAGRSLKVAATDYGRAVLPALLLTSIMMGALASADALGLGVYRGARPAAYLLLAVGLGGAVYAICFLLLPITALRTEADRWKRLIYRRRMA